MLTTNNWREHALHHEATPVTQRRLKLLALFVRLAGHRYQWYVSYELHDPSNGFLIDEPNVPAYSALVNSLVECNYVRPDEDGVSGFTVTAKGYEKHQGADTHRAQQHGTQASAATRQRPRSEAADETLRVRAKDYLERTGTQQKVLVQELGVHPSTISRFLKGELPLGIEKQQWLIKYLDQHEMND